MSQTMFVYLQTWIRILAVACLAFAASSSILKQCGSASPSAFHYAIEMFRCSAQHHAILD
jgi:hypothetical protein